MERDIGKPLFDLLLLIASAAAFSHAMTLPNLDIVGDLSPAFFPELISASIFLLALPCFIRDAREWQVARGAGAARASWRCTAQWLLVAGLTLGYILLFERLGYIPSTALFAFCCVIGFVIASGAWQELGASQRIKALAGAAVFAVLLAIAVYYIFTDLFEIPFPN